MGKVLDLSTNLILFRKGPRSSPVVRQALFACFFVVFVQMPVCNVS